MSAIQPIAAAEQAHAATAAEALMRLRELLEEARQELALGIAFIGRDQGTDRIERTLDGLVARFVAMDAKILADPSQGVTSPAPPARETEA